MKLERARSIADEVIKRLSPYCQVDIYIADETTWATLLLIRTGSTENNIRLCSRAKDMGWHLAASGDGLFNEMGKRIAGDTEISIYNALGLPYQEPLERN
jgi:DNA polymerase (family 10)